MSFAPQNPGAYPYPPPPPNKSNNTLLYVLLGIFLFCFLVCVGCAGLVVVGGIGSVQLAATGLKMAGDVVSSKVRPQLQSDPVIQQHIGQISKLEMAIVDGAAEGQKPRHTGRDMGFKIKGDKGEGLVMCRLDQSDPQNIRAINCELCLPNGEYHKLRD